MSRPAHSLALTLRATAVLPCPHDKTWVCCPSCEEPLELHQPNEQQSRRFIGTCSHCGRWYLLDWVPLTEEGIMLLLPTFEELNAVGPESPGGG